MKALLFKSRGGTMRLLRKASLSFLLLSVSLVFGFHVEKRPQTIQQPDGTELNVFVSGDQYCHWIHDAKNFTIVQNSDGYYVYADLANGLLVPTAYKVATVDPASVGLRPGLNYSAEYLNKIREEQGAYKVRPSYLGSVHAGRKETDGNAKFGAAVMNPLVIFVRFSGEAEFAPVKATYNGTFNTDVNSLKNYYLWNSYNQLSINSLILGGTATTILSYQDSHPRSYFQPLTASNPGGYDNSNRGARENQLWVNAINALKSYVPSGLNVDGNADGYVDEIYFVVKGSNDAVWASILWPHASGVSSSITINGATVGSFMCVFESWHDVGLLSHETGHVLGAPDFYRYSDNTIAPLSIWETMSNQTDPPQSMSAYTKLKYMGFINSIPEITQTGYYTLSPLGTSPSAYKIPSTKAGEYFVVEYRKKTASSYESQIFGSGLVIYRVNSAASGNGGGPPDELYVYRPGGTNTTTNGTISNAFFTSDVGRTQFTDVTSPNGFMSDNSLGHINITDIGTAGSTITFFYKKPYCLPTFTKTVVYTSASVIPSVTEAIQYIINSGTVTIASGQNKTFRSERVYLEPGFSAVSGSTFKATTPNCASYQVIPPAARLLAQTEVQVSDNSVIQDADDMVDVQTFDMFPNPATEQVQVRFGAKLGQADLIEVYNAAGVKLYTKTVFDAQQTTVIDLKDREAGVYYLKAISGKESATKMLIIKNK